MAQGPGFPRRVFGSNLRRQLVRLRFLARTVNRLPEVDAAVKKIVEALMTRPLPPATADDTFGDPRYTIPPFTISVAIVGPVAVTFGASMKPIQYRGETCYLILIKNLNLTV